MTVLPETVMKTTKSIKRETELEQKGMMKNKLVNEFRKIVKEMNGFKNLNTLRPSSEQKTKLPQTWNLNINYEHYLTVQTFPPVGLH